MPRHMLHQISPHVRWFTPDGTTDRPVLGVITGTQGSLVVDAGNSAAHAEELLGAMSEAGLDAPRYVALTHWHWDHVFGTARLAVPTFAHALTAPVVAEMATLDWSDAALDARVTAGTEIAFCAEMIKAELPDRSLLAIRPPDIVWTGEIEIDLGGVRCRLLHVGGDHAADAVVVHVPEDRVVFLGDCFYPDIYTPARRYTRATFEALADTLLALDANCYIHGHDDEPFSRAMMEDDARILRAIGRAAHEHGDRDAALAALPALLGAPLPEEYVVYVEYFLAGLGNRE
jgi:glyoxylase-like metal-dependent hydrolase (beta-lactamase superfamily II)